MFKKHLIRIIELTSFISFGTLIACGVWYFVTLASKDIPILSASIRYITLWEIPLLGFICALGTDLIFGDRSEMMPSKVIMRIIIHYIYINAAVLVCGYFFEWYDLTFAGVVLMLMTSAAIHGFTYFFGYLNGVKTADKMNRGLSDYKDKR